MTLRQNITDRQAEIIRAIVSEYLISGQPVGSQILVSRFGFDFSPATVRKEMSILEQVGLLASPHTSAGRVPTDNALELYVNDLLELYQITVSEKARLEDFYRSAKLQLDQLLQSTAHMLAVTSKNAGIVLSPVSTNSIVKRIELVSIHDNVVLLVMVSNSGAVFEKRLRLDVSVNQEDLYKISRFLTSRMRGYEIGLLQERDMSFLTDSENELNGLTDVAMTLAQSLVFSPPDQEVFIEGESTLYSKMIENSVNKKIADKLAQKLSDKNYICDLFNRLRGTRRVSAQIGIELDGETLSGVSVLAKGYSVGGKNVGALGVIGLNRMPYDKLIPTIDYSSHILSNVLADRADLNEVIEGMTEDTEIKVVREKLPGIKPAIIKDIEL